MTFPEKSEFQDFCVLGARYRAAEAGEPLHGALENPHKVEEEVTDHTVYKWANQNDTFNKACKLLLNRKRNPIPRPKFIELLTIFAFEALPHLLGTNDKKTLGEKWKAGKMRETGTDKSRLIIAKELYGLLRLRDHGTPIEITLRRYIAELKEELKNPNPVFDHKADDHHPQRTFCLSFSSELQKAGFSSSPTAIVELASLLFKDGVDVRNVKRYLARNKKKAPARNKKKTP